MGTARIERIVASPWSDWTRLACFLVPSCAGIAIAAWMITFSRTADELARYFTAALIFAVALLILWQLYGQRSVLTIDPSGFTLSPRRKRLAHRRTVWAPWCGVIEVSAPQPLWWRPGIGLVGPPVLVLDRPGEPVPARVRIPLALWEDHRFQSVLRAHLRPEQIIAPGTRADGRLPWPIRLLGVTGVAAGISAILLLYCFRYWGLSEVNVHYPPPFIETLRMVPPCAYGFWGDCNTAAVAAVVCLLLLVAWGGASHPGLLLLSCLSVGLAFLCGQRLWGEHGPPIVLMTINAWCLLILLASLALIAALGRRVLSWRLVAGLLVVAAAGIPLGIHLHGGVPGRMVGDFHAPKWTPSGDGFLAVRRCGEGMGDYVWHDAHGNPVKTVRCAWGVPLLVGPESALARSWSNGELYLIPRRKGDARPVGRASDCHPHAYPKRFAPCLSFDERRAFLCATSVSKERGWFEVDMVTGAVSDLCIPAPHDRVRAVTRRSDGSLLWLLYDSLGILNPNSDDGGIFSLWSGTFDAADGRDVLSAPSCIYRNSVEWQSWETDARLTHIIGREYGVGGELYVNLCATPPKASRRPISHDSWVKPGGTSASRRFVVTTVTAYARCGDGRGGVVDRRRGLVAPLLWTPTTVGFGSYPWFTMEVFWSPIGSRCLVLTSSSPMGWRPWRLMLYDFESPESQAAIGKGVPMEPADPKWWPLE